MLDNYRIVIRERKLFEQMDLSLRLIREHAAPLAVAFLLGLGPFFLFNTWLFSQGAWSELDPNYPWTPMFWMVALVVWELPLASAPATLYLGQALFDAQPNPRKIAADLWRSLGQLIFYQMILRGFALLTIVGCFVPFTIRPYMSEIILLERNPFASGRKGRMSTGRRAAAMHRGMGGDFFLRWLVMLLCAAVLVLAVWLSLSVVAGLLWNEWTWDGPFYWLFFPLAIWFVAAWLTVVRFLGYLDLRIRREGWEVELLMRAEATRWARQSA
jgi:hypothetical protein